MKIVERIKQFRKALGLNLTEFGEVMGVTQSQASKWEGATGAPKRWEDIKDRFHEFATACQKDPKELYYRTDSKGKVYPSKAPQECSPLFSEIDKLKEWARLIFDGTNEEWVNVVNRSFTFRSVCSWRNSELIAFWKGADRGNRSMVSAMEKDLETHGLEFVSEFVDKYDLNSKRAVNDINEQKAIHNLHFAYKLLKEDSYDLDVLKSEYEKCSDTVTIEASFASAHRILINFLKLLQARPERLPDLIGFLKLHTNEARKRSVETFGHTAANALYDLLIDLEEETD